MGRCAASTAGTPRTRSGGWCCISADIATPSGSGCPTATCTALQLANFWQDVSVDLREGSRVHSAGSDGAPRLQLIDELFAVSRDDAIPGVMKDVVDRARELFIEDCRWHDGGSAVVHRSRTVQPRRHAGARQDRSAELQRAVTSAPPSANWSECGCSLRRSRAPRSSQRRMTPIWSVVRVLPPRSSNSRLAISTIPSCCCRSRSAMPCARSTRSCATATI